MKLIFYVFMMFTVINMLSQDNSELFHKKWLVYKTEFLDNKPWHVKVDNYLLDFTKNSNYTIKYIGDALEKNIDYNIDFKKGIIKSTDDKILYRILKFSSSELILLDKENNEKIKLWSISEEYIYELKNIKDLLVCNKWISGNDNLIFTLKNYLIENILETNYYVFIKENGDTKNVGGWLLDSYEDNYFIELFSLDSSFRAVYQIFFVSETLLKAKAIDNFGNELLLNIERLPNSVPKQPRQ